METTFDMKDVAMVTEPMQEPTKPSQEPIQKPKQEPIQYQVPVQELMNGQSQEPMEETPQELMQVPINESSPEPMDEPMNESWQEPEQEMPQEPMEEEMQEPSKAPSVDLPQSSLQRVGPTTGSYSEDFLSRVNRNDKINNILRSPLNSARQRSVYTGMATSTSRFKFNASAPPFVSKQHHRSSDQCNGSSARTSCVAPSVGGDDGGLGNMPQAIPAHMCPAASNHYSGYEDPEAPHQNGGASYGTFNPRPATSQQTNYYDYENSGGRMASPISSIDYSEQFPQPMPPPPFAIGRTNGASHIYRHFGGEYEYPATSPFSASGPIVTADGTIQLRLREGIRIDMTLDRAVRVLNQRFMVAIALSQNCTNSAFIHPNGRLLQTYPAVEIIAYDGMKTNNFVRIAKMFHKGMSFTSDASALIYLLDVAGTRTTTDTFTDMTKDHTLTLFYDETVHGPSYVQQANEVVQNSTYSCNDEGTDAYKVNGFRITQSADGVVKVTRTHNRCLLRTSPNNGSATLTTASVHCTASLGKRSHMFVRRAEKRMHFDGANFVVRVSGHSSGFNEDNLLIVN